MTIIREYREKDEEQILPLFNQVFGLEREEDYWSWLYLDNPAEDSIIALAEAESESGSGSEIVGQCTLSPSKLNIKGETILAGQSIDTMVDADYRGEGLHKKMAERTYDIAREKDMRVRLGFPSQDALRGLLGSIDGTLTTEVPIYMNMYKLENFLTAVFRVKLIGKIFAIPGMALMKILHKEKRLKTKENYEIKEISHFGEDFDRLDEKFREENKIYTARTSEYLNWRVKDHPKADYKTIAAYKDEELMGYMVLKTEDRPLKRKVVTRLGSIVDLIALNKDVALALNKEAKKYFKAKDVDFVAMWVTETFKYRELFESLGYHISKSKIPFVVKDLSPDEKYKEIIAKEENWYLMPIESDFY